MFRVICTLPNASHEINGIAFRDRDEGGVESVEAQPAEVAANFATIPGYEVEGVDGAVLPSEPEPAAEAPVAEPVQEPVVEPEPVAPAAEPEVVEEPAPEAAVQEPEAVEEVVEEAPAAEAVIAEPVLAPEAAADAVIAAPAAEAPAARGRGRPSKAEIAAREAAAATAEAPVAEEAGLFTGESAQSPAAEGGQTEQEF